MRSTNRIGGQLNEKAAEFRGLSTDTKPIGEDVPNGSVFVEIDTSDVYMYSSSDETWYKF